MDRYFSRLKVEGYRRLGALDLTLKPLNVLIGANGVGKSSILEVLDLLAESANGRLGDEIAGRGGVNSVVTADGRGDIRIELERQDDPVNILTYRIEIGQFGHGYRIRSEELSTHPPGLISQKNILISSGQGKTFYQDAGQMITPDWPYVASESALSQSLKSYSSIEAFRHALVSCSFIYHILDVSERAPVRLPQALILEKTPGVNGESLLPCLYTLRESWPDRYEVIMDSIRAVFSGFETLKFPVVSRGTMSMEWTERGFSSPFYPNQLSEGTLRFLWLATLLQCPDLPPVLMIDEPEVSLHPEMLRLLVDLMREASERTQLIVATHSDRLVRFLKPDELVVCDLDENGLTTAKRGSEMDLDHWLEDYTLDQLWGMGEIGGRI